MLRGEIRFFNQNNLASEGAELMIDLKKYEVWFLTGSQHLYGPETLKKVDQDSEIIVRGMSESPHIPVRFVHIPVLTTPEAVMKICLEANNAASCIGVIAWMHTFSPAKMWIGGLTILNRPLLASAYAIQPATSRGGRSTWIS